MPSADPSTGLFAKARQLAITALEIAQVRVDLLVCDFEWEKRRILGALYLGALSLLLMGLGLALLCGFVVLLFWDSYRLTAAGAMALLLLGGGGLLLRVALKRLESNGGFLGASTAELRADLDLLRAARRQEP